MDNAPCHRSKFTQTKLAKYNFLPVAHPPNSPDVSPCDFYLFGTMKRQLQGCDYADEEELKAGVHSVLQGIDKAELRRTFEGWSNRCTRLARGGGKYLS
jgi:hypothetical protein